MAFNLASLRVGDRVCTLEGIRRIVIAVNPESRIRYEDGTIQHNRAILPSIANERGSWIERAWPDIIRLPDGI